MAFALVNGSSLLKMKNPVQPSDEAEVRLLTADSIVTCDESSNLGQGLQEEDADWTQENSWREGDGVGGMEGARRTEGGR